MREYWVAPLPPFQIADGSAYANSITLTDVAPTPAIVVPAGMLELGSRLEWEIFGRYSNTGTPTLTLGIYSGTIGQAIGSGVALCVSAAITTVSGVTNQTFRMQGGGQVRAVGTSGTILAATEISNVSTVACNMAPATAPATATIDTTVSRYITVGATWGTQSASNTLTIHHMGVRLSN